MDLVFCVSTIKIDANGIRVIHAQYSFGHHVNMPFKKKYPQLAMSMQQRDGGMISQGIGREIIQTLEPIGLRQISMGGPINPQLPIFSYALNHLNLPRVD